MIVHDGSGNLEDVKPTLAGVAGTMALELRREMEELRKTIKSSDMDRISTLVHQYRELKYAMACNLVQLRERFRVVRAFEPENEMEELLRRATLDILKTLSERFSLTQQE